MTSANILHKKIQSNRKIKKLLIALCGIFAFSVFFMETSVILDRMQSGLVLCSRVIIPSLFPYMVLSELLLFSGIDRLFEKSAGGLFEKIFSLPKCASSAFVLGILCGFPVGSKISYSLYEKGKITNDELVHLLLFCNIQSSAFIINTVGISLLKSRSAGIFLFVSQIISLTLTGIIYPKLFPYKKRTNYRATNLTQSKRESVASTFTQSVKSSVLGILCICGFVLFFSVLCGIVIDVGAKLNIPQAATLLVCSALEMSCGCVEIAGALNPNAAFFICAIVLGFSGISLHFQIMSLCHKAEIKYGRFFIFKLLSALIAGICAIILNLNFKIFA